MERKIRIEPSALFLWALGLLILPVDWFLAGLASAGIHELGHLICAKAMKIPVYSFQMSAGGCRMETGPMTAKQEFYCALAGPLGSFLLVSLREWLPLPAFCAAVQGLFNLLPMYPMDGGRILKSAAGERTAKIVSTVTGFCIFGFGLFLTFLENLGSAPAIFGAILLIRHLKTKNSLQTG